MTPKEKANELLDIYWLMDKISPIITKEQSKQCALIAVDEIIKQEAERCLAYKGTDNEKVPAV